MMEASDSNEEADSEHIQIGTSNNLALEGLKIVDLASVRRHLASISHWRHGDCDRPKGVR